MKFEAIMTTKSFQDLFFEVCSKNQHLNYQDAYEVAERQHELKYGCRRYASYDSFRITKDKDGKSKNSLQKR